MKRLNEKVRHSGREWMLAAAVVLMVGQACRGGLPKIEFDKAHLTTSEVDRVLTLEQKNVFRTQPETFHSTKLVVDFVGRAQSQGSTSGHQRQTVDPEREPLLATQRPSRLVFIPNESAEWVHEIEPLLGSLTLWRPRLLGPEPTTQEAEAVRHPVLSLRKLTLSRMDTGWIRAEAVTLNDDVRTATAPTVAELAEDLYALMDERADTERLKRD